MRKSVSAAACTAMAVAALTLSVSCRNKASNEPPVATPSLTLSKDKVPIGSPVKLTYKFTVSNDAQAVSALNAASQWVFVHVLDPTGEQLWTDDHLPPTPTSAWKPGQTIEYTRTIFV